MKKIPLRRPSNFTHKDPPHVYVNLPTTNVQQEDEYVGDILTQLARVTRPDEEYSGTMLANTNLKVLKPIVDSEVQRAINALSIANPDVSQMVNNIVQLGNTGHFVEIISKSKRQVKLAIERIRQQSANIYPVSAGVDGLVNDLLAQMARTGALSAEIVLGAKLKEGVKEIVIVPVSTIRWLRDEVTGRVFPAQYLGEIQNRAIDIKTDYIELNPSTYVFYRMDGIEGSPYPIPPIMAALGNLKIQMSMMKNISAITRKVGLVGFISILLKAPQMDAGETKAAYASRVQSYINEAAAKLTANYNDGLFVGLQNQHEVTHTSLTADLRGLQDVVQINEEQIFSGLKSDPAMHGRTYSTTETYAGVVFDKLLAQLETYKRLVKRFLEKMYKLDLLTQGITVDNIKVTFKAAKPLNELLEQQARAQKLANLLQELKIGLISWEEFSRKMGYDEPYRSTPDLNALNPVKNTDNSDEDNTDKTGDKKSDEDNTDKKKEKTPKNTDDDKKVKNVLDKSDAISETLYRGVLDVRESIDSIGVIDA